jgi:hypothetical protein
MNTIRHPRRRPRVHSTNFRTLGWLIRREAAWRILRHFTGNGTPYARAEFARLTTREVDRAARNRLAVDTVARYSP